LFQTLGLGGGREFPVVAFIVPVLAMMGALAVACFVKVFGVVFLGVSRERLDHPIRESGWAMRGPMCVLAFCCIAIGLGPTLVAPMLDKSTSVWSHREAQQVNLLEDIAPLGQLRTAAMVLVVALIVGAFWLNRRIQKHSLGWTETWGCGYTAPTPRMQYTASSIAQFLVELLAWPLQLKDERPHLTVFFPSTASFKSHVPEVVLERAVMPIVHSLGRCLFWFRIVQQGSIQLYILYIFAALVFLLLFWR
jgi:hydrogenase-4 component B